MTKTHAYPFALVAMLALLVTYCAPSGSDESEAPTRVDQAVAAPVAVLQAETLREWKPSQAPRGLGLEILILADEADLTEEGLINLVKTLAGRADPVIIKAYLTREAYEAELADDLGPAWTSGYLFFYTKNGTRQGAYQGFNEIRWMQETGAFSEKLGTVTRL
jgi:hypothetical protein